jgi:SAM-dependent methyltransferase
VVFLSADAISGHFAPRTDNGAMKDRQLDYPLDLAEMAAWVRDATHDGARVLEIGSGDGALTEQLAASGVDVVGVDPNGAESPRVRIVGLEELDEPPFDVVFASVSLHHLPDPERTVAALRRLTKRGTVFLVREFDRVLVDDEPTLRWWFYQRLAREAACGVGPDEAPMPDSFDDFVTTWREMMEHHVLPWATVRSTLERAGFVTESEASTAYLYRWGLGDAVRPIEEDLAARGCINRVGIRWTGRRH